MGDTQIRSNKAVHTPLSMFAAHYHTVQWWRSDGDYPDWRLEHYKERHTRHNIGYSFVKRRDDDKAQEDEASKTPKGAPEAPWVPHGTLGCYYEPPEFEYAEYDDASLLEQALDARLISLAWLVMAFTTPSISFRSVLFAANALGTAQRAPHFNPISACIVVSNAYTAITTNHILPFLVWGLVSAALIVLRDDICVYGGEFKLLYMATLFADATVTAVLGG